MVATYNFDSVYIDKKKGLIGTKNLSTLNLRGSTDCAFTAGFYAHVIVPKF